MVVPLEANPNPLPMGWLLAVSWKSGRFSILPSIRSRKKLTEKQNGEHKNGDYSSIFNSILTNNIWLDLKLLSCGLCIFHFFILITNDEKMDSLLPNWQI
jgi:hypothetical protein